MQQRRRRTQSGTIVTIGDRWFCRYWEHRVENGVMVQKRVSHLLGTRTTRSETPTDDIVRECERFMLTINQSSIPAENVTNLSDFVETVYLPWVKQFKRPSTAKGYHDLWENRLKPIVARERAAMRHTRTFNVQKWLNQLGKGSLGRNTLKHAKSVLSGIFTLAKQQGYFDGVNPVQGTAVNPSAREPEETHAYSLEEVNMMLSVLPECAATIFAVAAFAGLRHGELVGLDWEDFHDGALWISRSVWNGHVNDPKTRKSRAPVPVIKQLESRLEMHRLRCGNPQKRTDLR